MIASDTPSRREPLTAIREAGGAIALTLAGAMSDQDAARVFYEMALSIYLQLGDASGEANCYGCNWQAVGR